MEVGGYSQDDNRGVGVEICACKLETGLLLLLGLNARVLDPFLVGITLHLSKVGKSGQIRMRRGTVIALIEVVCENLPVVVSLHAVLVVENIVLKLDLVQSLLLVDAVEMLLPRLWVVGAVEVDPDEAIGIDLEVNLEETVLALVESIKHIVVGGLGEVATQTIRPAVILAGKD